MKRKIAQNLLLFAVYFVSIVHLSAQIPAGYYNAAIGKSGYALKAALAEIIDDHTVISYNDIWAAYALTDLRADGTIWDIYTNCAYTLDQGGGTPAGVNNECLGVYNREHVFCQSWFGSTEEPPKSDIHHIFPVDSWVNSCRNNLPYGEVESAQRVFQNGGKIGPNAASDAPSGNAYEPIDEYKGDIARAIFYISTRYMFEDQNFSTTASPMATRAQLKPWALQLLKHWHELDPVSQKEIDRNNAIYTHIQHNRNPFIDHPQLVGLIWGSDSVNFRFDADYSSVTRLQVTNLEVAAADRLVLTFDLDVVESTAENLDNYAINHGVTISSAALTRPNEVTLTLATSLEIGRNYNLTVKDILSVSNLFLQETILPFRHYRYHTALTAWTFDTLADYSPVPFQIRAEINRTALPSIIYLDSSHGSSKLFPTNLSAYGGTEVCDPRDVAFAGKSLSIENPSANGKSIVLRFSTRAFRDLMFSFATRRTATGFTTQRWEYSLDGEDFVQLENLNTEPAEEGVFELKTVNLSQFTEFNDRDSLFLRMTLDGCTSGGGNNRFDNFVIYGQKCIDTLRFVDSVETGKPYNKYGFRISPRSNPGTYTEERIGQSAALDHCDTLITLQLMVYQSATGIAENRTEEHGVAIFPNPAKNHCTIQIADELGTISIAIFDELGRLKDGFSAVASNRNTLIDYSLTHYKSGLYIVKVQSDKHCFTKKLLIN